VYVDDKTAAEFAYILRNLSVKENFSFWAPFHAAAKKLRQRIRQFVGVDVNS